MILKERLPSYKLAYEQAFSGVVGAEDRRENWPSKFFFPGASALLGELARKLHTNAN